MQVPLNTIYDDLQKSTTINGLTAPLFAYFRCPGANNISLESPLGVGIVATLDEINLLITPQTMLNIRKIHTNM